MGVPTEGPTTIIFGVAGSVIIWNALNGSINSLKNITTEEERKRALRRTNIGLISIAALSATMLGIFRKRGRIPAAVSGTTGLGLYAYYRNEINNVFPERINRITRRTIRNFPVSEDNVVIN